MRDSNERLVLSLVRRHGSLAKTEIARMTGLSAQTVSVIMRELEEEGLLLRQEPVRGKIGQPSIPMALNPDGAYFLGLKIGRRSAELVLIDFLGKVRASRHMSYRYPAPNETVDFVAGGIARIRSGLSAVKDEMIAWLLIVMRFELWILSEIVVASRETMEQCRHRDIRADIQAQYGLPVYLQNDCTSACGAELVFGHTGGLRNFIYFYIGAFAGGGIVLDGSLYGGATGNAGALGSMPVPGPHGRPIQLIDIASIATLEKALNAKGRDASCLWTSPEIWGDLGSELHRWINGAGAALAYSIVAASSVIDFEAAIIDGWMPVPVRQRLVAVTQAAITRFDSEGLRIPSVREGTVGIHARALGGASLPLSERFLVGANALTKGR